MISTDQLYPYLLQPRETPAIWGGEALVRRFGKAGDPHAAIGESWECWDANAVRNGPFAGTTLAALRGELGARLMGPIASAAPFPILTKFIDARAALSVQVHPDDAYAQRVEQQPNGKTECWYILEAAPDAELVLGWTRATNRAEYERRVADGTLGEILRRVPVRAGDAFYLPAGTLHAIGAGIVLFETQQTSDLTYRIFDWNRTAADGKPRELHVAKAGDVLDFRAGTTGAVAQLTFDDAGIGRRLLIADARFLVERIAAATGGELATHGRPLTLTALDRALHVEADGVRAELPPYATAVTPATAAVRVAGGDALVARPQPDLAAERAAALRSGADPAETARFFAQFA